MERLCLQADGFTTLDFEILPNGKLRLLSNTCMRKHYPEDKVFAHARFKPGKVMTFKTLMAYWVAYIDISNRRLHNNKISFNVKTRKVA